MLRRVLATAVCGLALLATSLPAARAGSVTDLAGRQVDIPAKVERIILGESRLLPVLAILEKGDPTARLVGMQDDLRQLDPQTYAQFKTVAPKLDSIPRLGRSAAETFSVERAIGTVPDLAIFGVSGHGPGSQSRQVIDALEAAGTKIVFIDFRTDPLANTPRSMLVLGEALGRQAEARAFVEEWEKQLKLVTDRLAEARPEKPRVFLESRVGFSEDCCDTMARTMMAHFLDAAGAENLGAALLPGATGKVSLEKLLTDQPQYWVGTAVGRPGAAQEPGHPRIALGNGATAEEARATLAAALARPGVKELEAVRQGRAMAIWHNFYNSPFNVVAVQALAKWLHPDLFADLDPEATMKMLYERFQPVPLTGLYWVEAGR
ncbi:ABC transporter substrate-binding protein [Roseomonas marmotae]|uniref:ABC transporter substrate-binding protein n=1 Tax=Roseomonas marmotae TaxID=2768161 RepID=A0ABS3KDR3_9PROT|nr:ABC transporter substrate-binding protein [Roseomonas marmotae]MBO1075580.1 ABC transporter substrate-binding protein [Roseomonas marmotae]QTI79444.1 ABC transporter substrate-binding protein [Roseomonas marmotae]